MKLSEVKIALLSTREVRFELPDGTFVPAHFHITEVGENIRNFIDCGGTVRQEKKINFQLWQADDFDHRLSAGKLLDIIQLSEQALGLSDAEVEVEFQTETIGKYSLAFNGGHFELKPTQTACLAEDQCGIPERKPKIKMVDLGGDAGSCCTPGGGCC